MTKEEIAELRHKVCSLFKEKFGNIMFDETIHRYTIDGDEYTPVSTLISRYENPFDVELRSMTYAQKHGMEQDDVKRMWKYKNLSSTIMGTRTHEFGESYTNLMCGRADLICEQNKPQYDKDENWLIPTYTQEFAIKDFYDNLHASLHPMCAEAKLSTYHIEGARKICGTADILFYYDAPNPSNSGFVVMDWKGLDIDTPIFTTSGWKTMGTIQVGDIVYDKDGLRCNVLHASEIHHRRCYKITFNNKDEIICDNEHRWLIEIGDNQMGYKEKVMTADEIFHYMQSEKKTLSSNKILKIRVTKPIQNKDIDLPIDPYVLGAWLGDGNKADGKITNMDSWLWNEIKKRGYEIGNDVSQGGAGKAQRRTIVGLTNKLRELNLLFNKHIPDIYLLSSESQRLDLLRGFMDTDGYYNKYRNRFTMHTTQEWQVEAIVMLASSLGIKPTIIRSKGKCNNGKKKTVFDKVDVSFTSEINPFLNKHKKIVKPSKKTYLFRNIIKIEEVDSVPTRCIEVDSPSSTFLCGKNFLVTHNTNASLTKSYARNTRLMMLPPFDDYYDEALSHYYIQFNLYQRMMESVGLNVIARRLIHLKHEGGYEFHNIPKIDDNIIDSVIYENLSKSPNKVV